MKILFLVPTFGARKVMSMLMVLLSSAAAFGALTDPPLFDLSPGSYTFTTWASTATAGTYPPNMVFQQTATQDPGLAQAMTANYTAAYNLTSGPRINGDGTSGFDFINTSSSGFLGAAELGLKTTGRYNIQVAWTGKYLNTITGDRVCAIRLQYSTTGAGGTWIDVSSTEFSSSGQSINYTANFTQTLPSACENQSTLYIRWKYYTVSGTTGTRPQLQVGAVTVSSSVPTITGTATATAFTTTYGTASTVQSFSISGANLTANITATAPTGFEVSSDGTTYGGTATFPQSGGTLRIRLAATAVVSGSYNSQNIVLSSTGATSVNITTAASGNSVSAKGLTISGLTGANKVYDGLSSASFTGTPAYSGLVNSESFSVSGAPSASFATATVANGKTITVTGYTAPSANYSLAQPTLTGNITTAPLNYMANTASMTYGGTVPSLSGNVTGFVNGENQAGATAGTLSFTTSATSSTVPGSYAINGSGLSAANYTFVQAAGNTTAFTINKANSSVSYAGNGLFTYNGAGQTPGVTFTGSTAAKTTTYVGTGYISGNAPTNAGSYYVSNAVAKDSNYFGTTNTQTYNISVKPASITADAKTKTYGDVNPALTAVTNGAVNGDVINITLGTTATQYSSVGVSNITVTLGSNPNYTVSATNSTLTINPAGTSIGASSSANPSGYKAGVSFTATLPIDATGSVVFSSPGGPFSTNPVAGATTTSLALGNLLRGTNLITVAYAGNGNYLGSTNTLNQIVTNHPPVALANTYSRSNLSGWKIAISDLLTNASDVIDGDTLTLAGVGTSTNLVTLDTTSLPGYVAYYNANPVADQFTYTVTDGFGGTNTATITLSYASTHPVTGTSSIAGITGTNPKVLTAYGIPNYSYVTQRSTNLIDWVDIVTNAAATNGAITISDYFGDLGSNAPGSAYYRLKGQ